MSAQSSQCRCSSAIVVSALLLLSGPASVADDFVIDDRPATAPWVKIVDPEFDEAGRVAWQDGAGNLWVARIDADSGRLVPPSGEGQLVDTGLLPIARSLNGPEWVLGTDGKRLAYTRSAGGVAALATARPLGAGTWEAGLEPSPFGRFSPLGTNTLSSPSRLLYFRTFSDGTMGISWRDTGDAASERTILTPSPKASWWIDQTRFLTILEVEGVDQLALVDIEVDPPQVQVVTSDPSAKRFPFAWFAPEFGETLLLCTLDQTAVGIYRQHEQEWLLDYSFTLPDPGRPFIHSPEAFTWQGRSYVSMVSAEDIGALPLGTGRVWVAAADQRAPLVRAVSDPEVEARRLDPESFPLVDGPVIYYNLEDPDTGRLSLRRAATGL
jgi:hypothetical protein